MALAALVLTRPAAATSVVPVTVEELTRRADAVVVATPRAARSQWLGGQIVTDVELEVHASARGSLVPGDTVTLRRPGGIVGRIGQEIPGVPSLELGRQYVVFLARGPGVFYLAHLTAAVLPMAAAPDGTVTVQPPAEGLATGPGGRPGTVMGRAGMPFEQLVRVLRSVR
jgi:hypothetical protein